MKKFLMAVSFVAAMVFCAVSCNCSGNKDSQKAESGQESPVAASADSTANKDTMDFNPADLPAEPIFVIETNLGTIKVKLYSKTPKHRDNFIKLAKEHFYDGTLFHRVINGFMIQGGEYYHKKGALAAARRGDAANPKKASSGSQFYLVQDEMNCLQLDGQYTVFGETVEGIDVIDKIAAVATDPYDCPINDVVIIRVYPEL